MVGHLEVKFLGKQGQRYENEKINGLEDWLKNVPRFREGIEVRRLKVEQKKVGQIT